MTILRSLLFVPGNKANMLDKALALSPDAFVPDMEDSVPAAEKANARDTIRSFLPKLAARGRVVIPRVNALDTDWFELDVAAVVGDDIFGISIGKVRTAADISEISRSDDGPPINTATLPWSISPLMRFPRSSHHACHQRCALPASA